MLLLLKIDNLPHVKLDTSKQKEEPETLKFHYGFKEKPKSNDNEKNYRPLARDIRASINRFSNERSERHAGRDINLPSHIDYISIRFQSQFDISNYYTSWANEFGFYGVRFESFNTEVVFAVTNEGKLNHFLKQADNFARAESGENSQLKYSGKILFIQQFKLLTVTDMKHYGRAASIMNLQLVDDLVLGKKFSDIFEPLRAFLQQNGIDYTFDIFSRNLEVRNATDVLIETIARNFDVVLNITSSLATVIAPSALNLPQRSYGFTVNDPGENAPVIGIIDTGISGSTPLAPLITNRDEALNITNTSVRVDSVDHGTAVAALAALGKRAYQSGYRGALDSDAKLLSIKVIDAASAPLSQSAVINLLRQTKNQYPAVRIFVLTICFEQHKKTNETHSSYAFELDKFTHEHDCLVFICTGNNHSAAADNSRYDLRYFDNELTNLCAPAESMNNLTVGAAADSLRGGHFEGISSGKEFPTLYTRKGHVNLASLFTERKINEHYFKPDVIECGGDYEFSQPSRFIGAGNRASMQLLSSNSSNSFYDQIGTSFSAPLAANVAAQILKLYPALRAQSIKALIVNAASLKLIRFNTETANLLNRISGSGLVNDTASIFSNDNAVTFLIEDEIQPKTVKVFPIYFPKYLTESDLGKKNGILEITATLCFSFIPVINHQLAYCPVHMAFSFFRNHTASQIIDKEEVHKSLLKSNLRWSQSGRHVSKPVAYSNVQKIRFLVNLEELISESSTFKLAVNCRINSQLLSGTEQMYNTPHAFSIALRIEENLPEKKLTGRLYSEMLLCNTVQNIVTVEQEGTAELG